jgi:hypothetical protein
MGPPANLGKYGLLRGVRDSAAEVSMPENHIWKVRDVLVVEVRECPTLDEALEATGCGGRRGVTSSGPTE